MCKVVIHLATIADPSAARAALAGSLGQEVLGAARYADFAAVGRTDQLQALIRGVRNEGLSIVEQRRVAGLLFDDDYAALRAEGLMELAVVRASKNDGDIVGGRIITRALHEWSDDYGDDVINALVLGTKDGDAVRAVFAGEGIPLLGKPEDITRRAFDKPVTIDTAQMSNILENLSSIRVARAGWGPTQSPSPALRASTPDASKEPDLYLNLTGKVADIISTGSTSSSETAALARAMQKVQQGQTQHVLINLDRSPWEIQDLLGAFSSEEIVLEGSTYSSLAQAIADGSPGTFPSNLANGSSFPVLRIDIIRGNELVQLYP